MRTRTFALSCVVLGFAIIACDAAPAPSSDSEPEPNAERPATTVAEPLGAIAVAGVTFDSTAIATHPGGLPATTLPLSAFNLALVAKQLVPTADTFSPTLSVVNRTYYESNHWHFEIDPSQGQILATSKDPDGVASPQNGAALRSAALQRLEAFGIPSTEIVAATAHRTMISDDAAPNAPTVDGYKTFVYRGFNGVHIRGHRAVVTHAVDGKLRRVLMRWPAIAATGHQLRTGLSTAQIVARATTAVQAEGFTSGTVKLRWFYVPTLLASGEVTLTLKVVASLPYTATLGEARVLEIDVDAT